jgi:integrase
VLPADPVDVAEWCVDQYLNHNIKPSTIQTRLSAISAFHGAAGFDSPTRTEAVRRVMAGLRRDHAQPPRRVRPLDLPALTRVVMALDRTTNAGKRDACALLLGFALAARRSELAALQLRDLEWCADGLRVTIRRSKTDQHAEGALLGVPYGFTPEMCPVRAVDEWLAAVPHCDAMRPLLLAVNSGDRVQPVGISGRSVATLVKRCVARAGLDPDVYSGHSMRAGLITAAAAKRLPEYDIARQSRHAGLPTLRGYIRPASVFANNVVGAVL